jgi:adenylyltransferase/sulfurtransferase
MQDRYSRQTLFAPIGKEGQRQLHNARVAIIGCGALGTVLANNLCRAGIGHLVIADRDYVELNNIQRQILFDEDDARQRLPKAVVAAEKLRRVNSEIQIEPLIEDINADGIEALVRESDLILDATDNFETRYLLNDPCIKHGRPWIYSGVVASYGITMNIVPGVTPCLRCAFPDMPQPGSAPTCDTAGVLNSIVGIIAGIASTETLKILLQSEQISQAMVWMDVWENTFERIELPRQSDCPACGERRYDFLDARHGPSATSLCGRNAVQVRSLQTGTQERLDFARLATRLEAVGKVNYNQYVLRLQVDDYDVTVFLDARAIIKGTDDQQLARSIYARYIGA